MNEINEQLKGISELVTRIDAKVLEITTKLDELIAALHEYDGNDEYGESSFEAFQLTNDYISSFNVDGAERRMDIIGQNGNTGEHYENEIINNPATTNTRNVEKLIGGHGVPNSVVIEKKKRDKRKYYKPKNK